MQDILMLQYIHQSADLGKRIIETALLKSQEPSFRNALRRQHRRYQELYTTSANYLIARGYYPKSANSFLKIGSVVSSSRFNETMDLAASMARRQRLSMKKSAQRIGGYKGDDLLVLTLANDLKKAEERSIEEMKVFMN